MSFITKRERVFNEYDLFDLPARNEGKLKAYASCTDARAWSHFCSDKSEHLVEIIKRNNDISRSKYVPTEAIVNTLLANKHAEISRLKRKIEEFEQMLAAYDELELTCDQKCEIGKAHAAIKEANKDLNELWIDLDMSGFTGDSEDFETGKSRGDEPSKFKEYLDGGDETPKSKGDEWSFEKEPLPKKESKGNQAGEPTCPCDASTSEKPTFYRPLESKGNQAGEQTGPCDLCTHEKPKFYRLLESKGNQVEPPCHCDASTIAVDPRIQELQDTIVGKDAKLNAMKNTMAVIENDVCEPYCIYAHIYTALEKIFGILCQNDKYKLYLNLMTAGKDTRCIDIKGKILFKLKVLEKFSLALIAPCSSDFAGGRAHSSENECLCYRAEITDKVETAYALTSAETQEPCLDNKRAQLVADIMENDEMKEILSKENSLTKTESDIDNETNDCYNIDQENVKRIKKLQENYDDLMVCYETLKHEKDCLLIRCEKYKDLEKEFESLQTQLREYNTLWSEKEHYRKRSLDLDSLKEQYLVLYDETTSLETELKAENEINDVKTKTIDELRNDNIALEKTLNEMSIAFEKEKNCAQCRLKESECTIMCQGQQIKSLSVQIDRLLEQDPDKLQSKQSETPTIVLMDEINSLKEQIKSLTDALYCTEEEKQQLQEEYKNKLNRINNLKMEVEDWKSNYEETLQRNDYLEKYNESLKTLIEENRALAQADIEEKSSAIEHLIEVISKKSQEIEHKNQEISDLNDEIHSLRATLEFEKSHSIRSLQIAKQESQELLKKVKDYDDIVHKQEDLSHSYQKQNEEYKRLKSLLNSTQLENNSLQIDLTSHENNNSILLQEIQRLKEVTASNLSSLEDEKQHYKLSLELTRKDSKILENKLHSFEEISHQLQELKESHDRLIEEKSKLENELAVKTYELDNAIHTVQLTKKESEELEDKLQNSENLKENVDFAYNKIKERQNRLQHDFDDIMEKYNTLKRINDETSKKIETLSGELASLKNAYDELLSEKIVLQSDCDSKTEQINSLSNALESNIQEKRELNQQIKLLENNYNSVQSSMTALQAEHYTTKNHLNDLKKESDVLKHKIQCYEALESEFDQLKKEHDQVKGENSNLQKELDRQIKELKKMEENNEELNSESQHLLSHSEVLEKALINARTELIVSTSNPKIPYMDIVMEIKKMKKEKIKNQEKIRDLLDKLEETDNIISDLSESILARDDKISILENHVNDLKDEVRRLHSCLSEMVDTGEQIKDNSVQRISESLNTMEAHHSKAAHNMKMELAKLQNDNITLEERLSVNKMKSEDSVRDKHKYISQIVHLQNEREIIVTDIKQLEMRSVGDSALSPDNCAVEDVLGSLDRIGRYLDARSSKSTSLEQTLLKVQNSYQIVQSKADEAKKIVEKEKQKIFIEKEEAIKDKVSMEKQLTNLKEQLEKQKAHDKNVIKDLESEILNQKLIFDKLNNSTKSYILKLKEEMQSLEELYQKSLENISELKKKLEQMSEEKSSHLELIKTVNTKLQEKSNEIDILKKKLEEVMNKPNNSQGIQAFILNKSDQETQTSIEFQYESYDQYDDTDKLKNLENKGFNPYYTKKSVAREKQKEKPKHVNEVQILTANFEPTCDVQSSYLNYKLKNLRFGRLEHYSIPGISKKDIEMDNNDMPSMNKCNKGLETNQSIENMNVIDIYNKQSMHTNSSKIMDSNYPENEKEIRSPGKISGFTDFGATFESYDTKSSVHKSSHLFESGSEISTDKDLFVIYKDSETNKSYDKKSWPTNGCSEILVEAVSVRPDSQKHFEKDRTRKERKHFDMEKDPFLDPEDEELNDEDDSVKHKLKISLPRVETDSLTMDTASDGDKKSLDSFTMNMYPVPKISYSSSDTKMEKGLKIENNNLKSPSVHSISKDEPKYLEPYASTGKRNQHIYNLTKKPRNAKETSNNFAIPSGSLQKNDLLNVNASPGSSFVKTRFENGSHHRLSRIDADVRLIKTTVNPATNDSKNNEDKQHDYGLDYILATVEVDPDNIKTYIAADTLRKTRSDEHFLKDSMKLKRNSDSSPSKGSPYSELKKSSIEYKTVSSNNESSFDSQTKTFAERSIMVKLDPVEEYESKIKHLTKNLENVEKDYKKKIDAIKIQYDSNIKSILNEHNEGVKSIQGLHEETLQDIIKHHENEVENLRSMSIDAMRKADKLEKEVRSLKCKIPVCSSSCLNEDLMKISTPELRRRRKSRVDTKTLTKTNVEAFNVRPKSRSNGPCTCSLDINISDTIRNIFEQVDVEQRKVAEQTYLKYIANKILNNTVEALDCQELSFLHLKVCRIWKVKLTKEETLQKRIDSLEAELMNKQRHTQLNMAELDRKVAEERRRLQEVREAVCRNVPTASRYHSPDIEVTTCVPAVPPSTADTDYLYNCSAGTHMEPRLDVSGRRSAGDLGHNVNTSGRPRRVKPENNRAVSGKMDSEERREKKLYSDEPPTRLRRPHDRQATRAHKK